MQSLLTSSAFWFALYAVIQLVVMQFFPTAITPDIWKAVDALVAIIIGAITGTKVYLTAKYNAAFNTSAQVPTIRR